MINRREFLHTMGALMQRSGTGAAYRLEVQRDGETRETVLETRSLYGG